MTRARARGALTFALPGENADYAVAAPSADPHIHQEMIEILCHTLYETVHVFFEHHEMGHDVGASGFLYPFFGEAGYRETRSSSEVAGSILVKARDARSLREAVAGDAGERDRARDDGDRRGAAAGGKLILFGNGGSATDATDLALDCVMPEDDAARFRRFRSRSNRRSSRPSPTTSASK